jgi:hypothetical protein
VAVTVHIINSLVSNFIPEKSKRQSCMETLICIKYSNDVYFNGNSRGIGFRGLFQVDEMLISRTVTQKIFYYLLKVMNILFLTADLKNTFGIK